MKFSALYGSKMFYENAQMIVFSEHAHNVLLFYVNAYWVGGLNMPTGGCSVCMPIMFVYSMFWGAK